MKKLNAAASLLFEEDNCGEGPQRPDSDEKPPWDFTVGRAVHGKPDRKAEDTRSAAIKFATLLKAGATPTPTQSLMVLSPFRPERKTPLKDPLTSPGL